jgi:hypothetical protein
MTLAEWIEKCGAIFARARHAETRLTAMALVALDEGCEKEARRLFGIAGRMMPLAIELVESLTPRRMSVRP